MSDLARNVFALLTAGMRSSALVGGYTQQHADLEAALADLKGVLWAPLCSHCTRICAVPHILEPLVIQMHLLNVTSAIAQARRQPCCFRQALLPM